MRCGDYRRFSVWRKEMIKSAKVILTGCPRMKENERKSEFAEDDDPFCPIR